MPVTKRTYKEALHEIVEKYREAGEEWPATRKMIAAWAYQNGLWAPSRKSAVNQLAEDIGRAMREDYMIDPQGRRVRRMHPRRVDDEESPIGEMKQKTLWDDMTTALPEHMQVSFQQRRHMILGDCHQLKTDVDSYNENYNDSEPIQMSFEFTEDLIEMEMPPDYPDSEDDDFDSEE